MISRESDIIRVSNRVTAELWGTGWVEGQGWAERKLAR